MDTIRPVKRLDSVGSLRASAEFVGSVRQRAGSSGSQRSRGSGSSELSDDRAQSTAETSPDPSHASNGGLNDVALGHALVDEIVGPVLDRLSLEPARKGEGGSAEALDARSIEAVSMIRKGFEDLADHNPGLAWHAMAEILSGINECVLFSFCASMGGRADGLARRHTGIRSSLAASIPTLLPTPTGSIGSLIRKSTIMTERGPAYLLPTAEGEQAGHDYVGSDDEEDDLGAGKGRKEEVRSPIAQMLYTRWVLNLREQRESSVFAWLVRAIHRLTFFAVGI